MNSSHLMDGDSIDDILGDLSDFDHFDDDISVEKTSILLIGRTFLQERFESLLVSQGYDSIFVSGLEAAADLLLRKQFALILLDFGSDMDLPSISNLLRKNYPISRLIMVYEGNDFGVVSDLFNDGSFDAIITLPASDDEIIKRILQQEAQFSIQQEVTNFVSEPPKLSKASFLLIDPSLDFGDPNLPLNFVGIMMVYNTVPRYDIFFENALANDQILFAAFLSSISSLGDELFQSEESLKEINFGGISVIFRFYGKIQIAFLVENLTRHNYENADKRIDEVMDVIFPEYEDILADEVMEDGARDKLDKIFNEFDQHDEIEEEAYAKEMAEEERRKFGTQTIIFLTNDPEGVGRFSSYLELNQRIVDLPFEIEVFNDINKASEIIRDRNVAIVILDESQLDQNKPLETGLFILESIEELDPSIQIIYISMDEDLDEYEIELLNSGNVDYVHTHEDNKFKVFASIQEGLKKSIEIKKNTAKGVSSGSKDGLSVAKSLLKENLEAFDSEDKPALLGMVIAQNKITSIDPIFSKFYEVDGEIINFDVELMAGLVTSLKQISGEMFSKGVDESIDGLELGGHNVFVRFNADFLFIYFIKNITPNTSILISKELDAVTQLLSEIISESIGVLSADDLEPIFSKIALKTHESLTSLLEESGKSG